ncbi:hypothetical protein GHT09_015274 [Marmota monax]|uniref:Bromo domain-containing protein n=1 Tax=Marmota monax TaxID=9995 RepID=A0A834Q902_MARMO|nr:hypothetical protein GHT09_015274 [Marmota monax]
MTMLTIEQLSYLLKFAIQKMKQPGIDAFQKPVPLEQYPGYAEYIIHPMDLCTLEKNAEKKMYGCTEVFLADTKWILHNCIIYNGAHPPALTLQMQLSSVDIGQDLCRQTRPKRFNIYTTCLNKGIDLILCDSHLVLVKDEGRVDAISGKEAMAGCKVKAWVPINNCYLMSKEIPFSVKKTKSIFNSAMQEMEVYVENIRRKFGVFNYSPFRTTYMPKRQAKTDKQEKVKLNFYTTASPKILMSKPLLGAGSGCLISLLDMPCSPMSTNSSVHTGSDVEQDAHKKATSSHFSASEESVDFLDKSTDGSNAEMDLKDLSESMQQQSTPAPLISPKRQIRSRFQLNLDKTIESCKAQLGINKISEDVYTAMEHSDWEHSKMSESRDKQKSKNEPEDAEDKDGSTLDKEPPAAKKKPKPANPMEVPEELKSGLQSVRRKSPQPRRPTRSPRGTLPREQSHPCILPRTN